MSMHNRIKKLKIENYLCQSTIVERITKKLYSGKEKNIFWFKCLKVIFKKYIQ